MTAYNAVQFHFKTRVPLYDELEIHLVIAKDIAIAHAALKIPFQSDCARRGGETHMDEGSFDVYLIINEDHITYEWLGHELSHVVNAIAGRVGIDASRDNDEADARIAGFLHAWVYKILEKSGLKVTHKPQ
jgi:hypothetical protein